MQLCRILLVLFLLAVLNPNINAQELMLGCEADAYLKGANQLRIDRDKDAISYFKLSTPMHCKSDGLTDWLKEVLEVSTDDHFVLYRRNTDSIGFTHYAFQHTYKGIPVKNSVYTIHCKNEEIISANGSFFSDIELDVSSNISAEAAIAIGKNYMPGTYKWSDDNFPKPELKILVLGERTFLTYQVDIYTTKPLGRKYLMIDAKEAKVIQELDRIHKHTVPGKLKTRYSGTQFCPVDSVSPVQFFLRDLDKGVHTWDLNHSTDSANGIDFLDEDNCWDVTQNKDNAAYDAHWGSVSTDEYLLTVHSWDSFDNAGATINSYVHYDWGINNAFYDGDGFLFGDGDGAAKDPYTPMDIVAHEIMHGVIDYSSGLNYSSQSGALNESFCDILGVAVDHYMRPNQANYLIGDENGLNNNPHRNMANPNALEHPDTFGGAYWHIGPDDNYGVHTNSGVQNYWFYLLAEGGSGVNDNGDNYSVDGIGIENAMDIAFRNATTYLTPSSNYNDAFFFANVAATDLFGICSPEVESSVNAWHAVGLGAPFVPVTTADFSTTANFDCNIPATFHFTNLSENSVIFLWDFGDGTSSTEISPVHTYTSPGIYTVSLLANGDFACEGSDFIQRVNCIEVSDGGGPSLVNCNSIGSSIFSGARITEFNYLDIANNSGTNSEAYEDFSCSYTTNVQEGIFLPVEVQTGLEEKIAIWVDLNDDGNFDNNYEKVYESPEASTLHSFQMAIPAGGTYGKALRLRLKSNNNSNNALDDACPFLGDGQIEDYSIQVSENVMPVATDFTVNHTLIPLESSVQFWDLSANAPVEWFWEFEGGTPSTSTDKNPMISYSQVGSFAVSLTVSNAYGTDSMTKSEFVQVTAESNLCSNINSFSMAVNGTLYDSGGPGSGYGDDESCDFLISPNCAESIVLSFTYFQSQSCCDSLTVYDGSDASAPILLISSGPIIPEDVVSTGGKMFVNFSSNEATSYAGFEANWSSTSASVSPIADFIISDINPPVNSDVFFSDQTLNFVSHWLWDFGDGSTSSAKNPMHQYANSGTYEVSLIVNNCIGIDTIVKTVMVQGAPNFGISPSEFILSLDCYKDTILEVSLTNFNGLGDLLFQWNPEEEIYHETSQSNFTDDFSVTNHVFENIPSFTTEINLEVTINGDFSNSSQIANIYIDGDFIGINPGSFSGGDKVVNFSLDSTLLSTVISDGVIEITVENTDNVEFTEGLGNYHRVSVQTVGKNWITAEPAEGILNPDEDLKIFIYLDTTDITFGIHQHSLQFQTNDTDQLEFDIPITLNVLGIAEMSFPMPCLNFPEIMEFTTDTLAIPISNIGCDTLIIASLEFEDFEFYSPFSPISIGPFETDSVIVIFAPTGIVELSSNVNFITNDGIVAYCLEGSSFSAPEISVEQEAYNVSLLCGQDTSIVIEVINSGEGQLSYDFTSASGEYYLSSNKSYEPIGNPTEHVFGNIPQNGDSLKIQVVLNGDFDHINEYASIYIDGEFIEDIDDGNPENGTDIVVNFFFTGSELSTWLTDGQLIVEIHNSTEVDFDWGGDHTHTVEIFTNYSFVTGIELISDTIEAESSLLANVNLSSESLVAGSYKINLLLSSNDPIVPFMNIPIILNIAGSAEISSTNPCFDFPAIMQYSSDTIPMFLENTGCDTLLITNFAFNDPEFSTLTNQISIAPNFIDSIAIVFTPSSIGFLNSELNLTTNIGHVFYCLQAESFGAPIISVEPESLDLDLSCGQDTSLVVIVFNSGPSPLAYNFSGAGGNYDTESTKSYINSNNATIHLFSNLPQSANGISVEVTINGDFDQIEEYASLYIDGQFIEEIADGNVSNGGDIVTNYTFSSSEIITWLQDGELQVKICNSDGVDSGWVGEDYHKVRVQSNGSFVTEIVPVSGVIEPVSSSPISISVSSDGFNNATHELEFPLFSSDPITPLTYVPIVLNVTGTAEIHFPTSCLNFPEVMQFASDTMALPMENTGCDDLDIFNMVSSNPAFSSQVDSFVIPAFTVDTIMVVFAPENSGPFEADLQILSNIGVAEICLSGNSINSPVSMVSPSNIELDLYSCGDTVSVAVTIENTGAGDFIYEFSSLGTGNLLDYVLDSLEFFAQLDGIDTLGFNESETFNFELTTSNSMGGIYEDVIEISSNDPFNPITSVPISINVSFDPCADFIFGESTECAGLVNFTTILDSMATTYFWDFGDGSSSTESDPLHQYYAAGSYEVVLTVGNDSGSDMINYWVEIEEFFSPIIEISSDQVIGEPISFTAVSCWATNWFWDFGDGTGTSGPTVQHTYSEEGIYIVQLTVINESGYSVSILETINLIPSGIEEGKHAVRLYPNPVYDFLTIENQNSVALQSLNILNSAGQIVDVIDIEGCREKLQVQLDHLPSGLYWIRLEFEDDRVQVEKLLIY